MEKHSAKHLVLVLLLFIAMIISACNLGAAPAESVDITDVPTQTVAPTRTLLPNNASTPVTITPIAFATQGAQQPPTSVVVFQPTTSILPPITTMTPISIFILSPANGNVIAGNIQILGSAIHPNFLQYRLEYGPDPNPNNLWFPITGTVQTPILNSVLGIWNTNTTASPDGIYQIRLRVILRDGTEQTTIVNNIRIRNQSPTPVPTNTPIVAAPIAAFTQDLTSGEAPLVVRFTNLSQGNIVGYNWEFGDGSSKGDKNPTHTFKKPGLYTVRLTVFGPSSTANVSRQINVKSATAPIAAFTQNTLTGKAPLTVNFSDKSTGNITTRSWNFGDDTTSPETNPTHVFATVGTFNVILEVKGPGGTSKAVRQITVENPQVAPPVAKFVPNTTTGNEPLTVTFTNQSTGEITTHLWDFNGDGITDSVDKNPMHIFTNAGTFKVNLVEIGPGGQSSVSVDITVSTPPNAPMASFQSSPLTGDAPLTVAFSNTSTGDITESAWDFNNDGVTDSNETNSSFVFSEAGTYNVKLTVTGPGGSTTAQATITVTTPIAPPSAGFNVAPDNGNAPLDVTFTNMSTGDELTYSWDFNGDGVIDSTDAGPHIFSFEANGSYTAKLTVANSVGSNSATKQITVNAPVIAPVAAFTADPNAGTAPLTVNFANTSTGDITTYQWDFNGDGTPDSTDAAPLPFNYDTPGTYNASLVVSGPGGSSNASATITVNAPVIAPVAAFTADPNAGTAPLTVNFANTSTGDITAYQWDFNGDGTPDSTDAAPLPFNYDTPGTYNASLVVSGPGGSSNASATITVNAPVIAPVAAFTADPNAGTAPLTVNFANTSTGDITTYQWDFNGDGTPDSTDAAPLPFNYDTPGTYNASLVVSGPGGSSNASATITVNAPVIAPVAAFTADPNAGTAPLTVNFANTSTGDITAYQWDFNGDGTPDSTDAAPLPFNYDTPGTYNASLVVSGPGGSSNASATITVNAPVIAPVAAFTADPNAGTAPLTVNFANTSTGDITAYQWDFNGDGTPDSTDAAPLPFNYDTPGTYNASLVVSGPGGSSNASATITVNAPVIAPVAAFTADPNAGTAPLTVNFANTSTGDITAYQWDFNGDGTPDSFDVNTSFVFNDAGTYNVTLTVSGPGGSSAYSLLVVVNVMTSPSVNGEIAFVSDRDGNNEIYVMAADGGNQINATNHPANDREPSWSPDGSKIAFVTDRDGNDEIYILSLGDMSLTNLTQDSGADFSPSWSPDSSKIAFVSNRFGDNDVMLVDANGNNPIQLTVDPTDDNSPVWSPDNLQVAFVSDRDGNNNIFLVNVADTSNIVTLTTDGANDRQPAWSHNGAFIVFVSDRNGGNNEIFIMSATDGGNVIQLTSDGANDRQPAWSPDDGHILFVSDRVTGEHNIYMMNSADGSNVTQLTNNPSTDSQPDRKP